MTTYGQETLSYSDYSELQMIGIRKMNVINSLCECVLQKLSIYVLNRRVYLREPLIVVMN